MFGPIDTLRTLASATFDAMAALTWRAADRLWDDAKRRCAERAADELAEREAEEEVGEPTSPALLACEIGASAASALIEHFFESAHPSFHPSISAAPDRLPRESAAAAERPAPERPGSATGAGHPNVSTKLLRVAADGLREWTDGDACTALNYWRSIAVQLDALAGAHDAINEATK